MAEKFQVRGVAQPSIPRVTPTPDPTAAGLDESFDRNSIRPAYVAVRGCPEEAAGSIGFADCDKLPSCGRASAKRGRGNCSAVS